MKKLLATALLVAFSTLLFSQNNPSCETVSLKTEADIKSAEPCIIKAADYVLARPLVSKDPNVSQYRGLILAWIEKTPDYIFSLNSEVMKLTKDDENIFLFGTYAACMAKATLENPNGMGDAAIKLLAQYVADPKNGVKQTAGVKKLIKAAEANDLSKYL